MQNIILCIDFSRNTERVIDKGIELAKSFGSQLILIHVTHAPFQIGQSDSTEESVRAVVADTFKDEHHQLQELSQEIRNHGIEARSLLVEGSPINEIVMKEAEKLNADLIIVSTKGHSRIGGFCLGSFSQRLLESVSYPVLVVPGA